MGKFISVSGSVICNDNQFELIKEYIISFKNPPFEIGKEEMNLYNSAWVFSSKEINWSRYIFYGCDVRETGVELIKFQVNEILKKLKLLEDVDDQEVEGIFYFSPEDSSEYLVWKLGSSIKEFVI